VQRTRINLTEQRVTRVEPSAYAYHILIGPLGINLALTIALYGPRAKFFFRTRRGLRWASSSQPSPPRLSQVHLVSIDSSLGKSNCFWNSTANTTGTSIVIKSPTRCFHHINRLPTISTKTNGTLVWPMGLVFSNSPSSASSKSVKPRGSLATRSTLVYSNSWGNDSKISPRAS